MDEAAPKPGRPKTYNVLLLELACIAGFFKALDTFRVTLRAIHSGISNFLKP